MSDIQIIETIKSITKRELKQYKINDLYDNSKQLFLRRNAFALNPNNFVIAFSLSNISKDNWDFLNDLKRLSKLEKLQIFNCQITDLSFLNGMFALSSLDLELNKIKDISNIAVLNNLSCLRLSQNEIENISALKGLKKLTLLDLQFNKIKELPEWISDFSKTDIQWKANINEGFISFYDNPIENIPIEIIEQGKAAIIKYFEELKKEEQQYNFEAKLMIIGEGGTGKTSLLKKLLDKNSELPNTEDTTLGIDIQKWNYPINRTLFEHLPNLKQDNMLVNIWDLGGQKIYHGTHQIFFGENTYYILVEETREHKTDFVYWFNTLEQLVGEKANLMIVINEKFGHVFKFDSDGFKSRFGFVKDIFELDLSKKDHTIVKLQEDVKYAIQHLSYVGQILPASYIRIKEELFEAGKNYISFDKFQEICENQGVSDTQGVRILSKYLHEAGTITHFIDDDMLRNRVFLKSEWLVKTIYIVLDDKIIKEKKGRISKDEICDIWNTENLGFEMGNLIQLMNKFGLLYKVKNKDEYVIPAHLPTEKPYQVWQHQNKGSLLIFKYEFGKYMPEGLMSHLTVSLHTYIENESYVWHRGVNLHYEKAFAEIIETYGEINTIEIRISGSHKREMLAIIRHSFSEIIKPFKNLYYKELIPCDCEKCKTIEISEFYEYKTLQEYIEEDVEKIQCRKSKKMVDVKKLIEDIILQEEFIDIKELIAKGEIKKALDESLKIAKKNKNRDKENEIIFLLARYSENEKSRNQGISNNEDYRLEQNKIVNSLLELRK